MFNLFECLFQSPFRKSPFMIYIIVSLLLGLVIFVVVVSSIRQHKEKIRAEKRARVAKQKLIMDENEHLIVQLANLPCSPNMLVILNKRSLNAAKRIQEIIPTTMGIKKRIDDLTSRIKVAQDKAETQSANFDETFILPDDDKQLIALLQSIKKIRITLKSEQAKGELDGKSYNIEEARYSAIQLKINVETLTKRGIQAKNKGLNGSARQFLEKSLMTLSKHPIKTEYVSLKEAEVKELLSEITDSLKNSNATDAAKKAEGEVDELDLIFQPKKKW